MKSQLLLSFLLASAAAPAFCAEPPATLPAWDQLTPAQRDLVVAPVRDRWNADPAARARMLGHAQRWQQLSPDQRIRMRRGLGRWEHMDPEQRQAMRALFHKMRAMTPAQRDALRGKWRAMTPQQRHDWVEANAPPAD
jgi:hypothetical protein